MYINTKTGCAAVGTAGKDGEYKEVGEKKTPLIKFSLAVGKDETGGTLWFECQAWNPVAKRFRDRIKKGDVYLALGTWESREYNGKTYQTLTVSYIGELPEPVHGYVSEYSQSQVESADTEEDITDEDLPF